MKELLDAGHDHLMSDALDGTLNEAPKKSKSTKGSDHSMAMTDEEKLAFDKLTADCGRLKSIRSERHRNYDPIRKNSELEPLAELGTKYREDVVQLPLNPVLETKAMSLKRIPSKMFSNLSIEEIQMGQAWGSICIGEIGIPLLIQRARILNCRVVKQTDY